MPDILSQDEIDKGLIKAEENFSGKKSEEPRPIFTYDFRHPTQVSKLQVRILENLHSNMARMLASNYSRMLRTPIDVKIAFVDQTTYAEFIMALSNPSCSYTFTIEPLGGPAIMDFSWNVVQPFIDREFGGVGATHTEEIRPVTSIERTVMARVATRALADLEAAWAPMIKIQVSDAELETNPEFMQICAPADTVILIAFEVKTEHMSGRIFLCYPYFTIEPVCALMTPRSILDRQLRRKDTREHRLQGLKRVPTELRIVWGRGNFSPADVACIKVGDTIVLDTKASDPAIIYVEDQPLFLSRPGTGEGGSCSAEVLEATPPVDDFDPLYLEGRHMSDASTAGKASSVKQTPDPNWPRDLDARLCRVGGATVEVTVELGRTQIPLEEVLQIEPGNVIETRKVTGQPMDILVNGALYAKGEVVVIGDDLAIRITDLIEH